MSAWQYKKIPLNVPRRRDVIDLLCDAGEQGWEVVAILPNGIAYLKREVSPSVIDTAQGSIEEFEDTKSPAKSGSKLLL